jgi:hypothetical protein
MSTISQTTTCPTDFERAITLQTLRIAADAKAAQAERCRSCRERPGALCADCEA